MTEQGGYVQTDNLSGLALQAMLVEPSRWSQTCTSFCSPDTQPKTIITLGPERCIPPSLGQSLPSGFDFIHLADVVQADTNPFSRHGTAKKDNDIAIIGMACKVAGADDLDEFWDILQAGKSQHTEVPESRFGFETAFRDHDPKRKWYGNFVKDIDAFDHKFFKKTPREAASTDPQQRLLMEVAYQAVEQSGYFRKPNQSSEVGCFVGVCATDYENNIACHAPNAFSSTGNLRGFIAGKVSHYFGWTGPGLTIDTACSSAAVAVHQACMAILNGECSTALAGAVNALTQPLAYQNLAGASFLSPTGQCKPFCTHADGYCRGEGVVAVYLKKRSEAIADGDQIFGILSGTAVQQNQNCTPLFVPNVPSLSDLFSKVLSQARVSAQDISYVEAHGTGTGVGDPAEYDSISQVLAVGKRASPLQLGSVKGLVGHTESSSGLVSLIKVLLMMHHSTIPPQASFEAINPHIKANTSLAISKSQKTWSNTFKAALINNYGASGSNASLIVTNLPQNLNISSPTVTAGGSQSAAKDSKYPFWLAALDDKSLRAYTRKLKAWVAKIPGGGASQRSIATLSFNISRQSNRQLPRAILLSCSTLDDLQQKLSQVDTLSIDRLPQGRPVILCFGGQVSTFVGLDRALYEETTILRFHLDECDGVCRALGLGSIYPDIFRKDAIQDTIKLQICLFSIQYASAKSWMSCGVSPSGLVGHSFGELTALCISETLTLQDSLKMISGRAKIIRDEWGPEKGTMMAVEGDLDQVERLVASTAAAALGPNAISIACYNGPTSFTLAGTDHAIETAEGLIASDTSYTQIRRTKKLNVTNAFHSSLVDGLKSRLELIGRDLKFRRPTIPIEFATESADSRGFLDSHFVADHMRDPVYFHHAVRRLAAKHPSSVWLEAGSNSTVTNMASRALGAGPRTSTTNSPPSHLFVPVNLAAEGSSTSQLTAATLDLWKAGLNVDFWQHHSSQSNTYAPMILPSYQFDKSRHWMDLKVPAQREEPSVRAATLDDAPRGLWTFEGFQDSKERSARFRINTEAPEYREMVASHTIAQTAPICPATLEVDMAIEALASLRAEFRSGDLQPQVHGVQNQAPICLDSSRAVWLNLAAVDTQAQPVCHDWSWTITSESLSRQQASTLHVSGRIIFVATTDPASNAEFARYSRLISHRRCVDILSGNEDDDEILQGRSIYRMFDDVVQYGERYQGLQRLVGRRAKLESAGRVVKKYSGDTWLDAHLSDCFSQVGGIWVNCMTDRSPSEMYIASGFELWARSPNLRPGDSRPDTWDVLAGHEKKRGDNGYVTDIFIFDPRNGALVEVILGINYAKVSKSTMSKLLSRLTPDLPTKSRTALLDQAEDQNQPHSSSVANGHHIPEREIPNGTSSAPPAHSTVVSVAPQIREILAELSGLEPEEIKTDSHLPDLGIDSLMGMELAREIENTFQCSLTSDALLEVVSFQGLVQAVETALGVEARAGDGHSAEDGTESSTTSSEVSAARSTAQTSTADSPTKFVETEAAPKVNGNGVHESGHALELSASLVLESFAECRALTDRFIEEHQCDNYMETVMPTQTELCVALTLEAFTELGCNLETARPGQHLQRITHVPLLGRLVDYLYDMLATEAKVVERDGISFIRTSVPVPSTPSAEILALLLRDAPRHHYPHRLTHFAGSRLADVLSGKTDGVKVIFGSEEGRELASGLYADSPLNKLSYTQMRDFVGRLVSRLPAGGGGGPLRILELGAGTGGTTKWIVPLLAELDIPVVYTFSDLAPSFVAAARKRFGKQYPFMNFQTVDVEKEPPESLLDSYHMVLASNAVHATHSLTRSLGNIRKTLRKDGFILILEMTRTVYWVDMIFGLLEGWWLFDDGREHAIAHQDRWARDLHSVGYGHVEWTDGSHPEATIQRVILALKDGENASSSTIKGTEPHQSPEVKARQSMVDAYVEKYTKGFLAPVSSSSHIKNNGSSDDGFCVLVTGATGSLGSHLVEHFSQLPKARSVICLNRRGNMDPFQRQVRALTSRGIASADLSKVKVLETDSTKPMLGLDPAQYQELSSTITHIVHNSWPMSGKRPLRGFESQFKTMRNLVDLASAAASSQNTVVSFQFVSSIAVVGHRPLLTGDPLVPEARVTTAAEVLPNGYGDAKWACERMLDETLHRHPRHFRAAAVRLGQIAGSRRSGYWNHAEHLTFLVQSSQALGAFPALGGLLSWTPVDDVAAALGDLVLRRRRRLHDDDDDDHYPIYHIDNPVRQPWRDMVPVLAQAIGAGVVDFREWVRRVRSYDGGGSVEGGENPAAKLVDFFDEDFERMSCGGLLLDTSHACEHSESLRAVGPVGADTARKFVDAWKAAGVLKK